MSRRIRVDEGYGRKGDGMSRKFHGIRIGHATQPVGSERGSVFKELLFLGRARSWLGRLFGSDRSDPQE